MRVPRGVRQPLIDIDSDGHAVSDPGFYLFSIAAAMRTLFLLPADVSDVMLRNPSLVTRIGIGKAVGFAIGLAGFFTLLTLAPEASSLMRWGVLFWYTTLGAIIGVFGVFTSHPVLKLPFPWWVRAPVMGAWMNFVLVLFAFGSLQEVMIAAFSDLRALHSPYWLVVEGALAGLVIGYFATRFGGEGSATVNVESKKRNVAA
ncbi:MAG: hypothetical protein AAF417_18305 [Pseudomonadota bacterium]